MYNDCHKHSKDVTNGKDKKKWFRYVVKGELANNKQIYCYFTGFVTPFKPRIQGHFSDIQEHNNIFIIQGLHAVQNQSNNNLLCCYLILPLKVFVVPINPARLTAPGSPRMEFVLDEQQFQELSPLNFLRTFQALNLNCNSRTFKELPSILLCEQRFLSCMTFNV